METLGAQPDLFQQRHRLVPTRGHVALVSASAAWIAGIHGGEPVHRTPTCGIDGCNMLNIPPVMVYDFVLNGTLWIYGGFMVFQ